MQYSFSNPQLRFLFSKHKFPAFVAGYGSGKTFAGVHRVLKCKFEYPYLDTGYYLPTYDLIARIGFPRFEEILTESEIPYKLKKRDKVLSIENAGDVVFRSMDKPSSIIGYEHGDAVIDEIDTLPEKKADEAWKKIIARNRQKKRDGNANSIGVVTTPEGFRFVYKNWKKKPLNDSIIIKASTYSNAANLPGDYIEALIDNYPTNLLQAYLHGEFVNLTSGAVYSEFNRDNNKSCQVFSGDEIIHVGMDFNVGKMSAVVHVLRDDVPHAVDEFVNILDTPDIIKKLKEKYANASQVIVYPDSSGQSRKTVNASESDISLLRSAGMTVFAKKKNPFVKDRIAAFNKKINKDNDITYFVNIDKCPNLVESLETQCYNEQGEPDKSNNLDHIVDAAGYFLAYRYPIMSSQAFRTNLTGV